MPGRNLPEGLMPTDNTGKHSRETLAADEVGDSLRAVEPGARRAGVARNGKEDREDLRAGEDNHYGCIIV